MQFLFSIPKGETVYGWHSTFLFSQADTESCTLAPNQLIMVIKTSKLQIFKICWTKEYNRVGRLKFGGLSNRDGTARNVRRAQMTSICMNYGNARRNTLYSSKIEKTCCPLEEN